MEMMYEVHNISSEINMSVDTINSLFRNLENPADGNCLFYAISQCLYNGSYAKYNEIRKKVCDFYKIFDFEREYPEGTLEYKLKMELLFDEDNHKKQVCKGGTKNPVWGIGADITAIAILYKINIITFNLFINNLNEYSVIPVKSPEFTKTIYIRLDASIGEEEHYEAMIPKNANIVPYSSVVIPFENEHIYNEKKKSPKEKKNITKTQHSNKNKTTAIPITVAIPIESESDIKDFSKEKKKSPKEKKNITKKQHSKEKENKYIGETVVKYFNDESFIGKVISYDRKDKYYLIEYEDGDTEEFTEKQLNKYLLTGGGKISKKRKSKKK
jgi:hypothetical protein